MLPSCPLRTNKSLLGKSVNIKTITQLNCTFFSFFLTISKCFSYQHSLTLLLWVVRGTALIYLKRLNNLWWNLGLVQYLNKWMHLIIYFLCLRCWFNSCTFSIHYSLSHRAIMRFIKETAPLVQNFHADQVTYWAVPLICLWSISLHSFPIHVPVQEWFICCNYTHHYHFLW